MLYRAQCFIKTRCFVVGGEVVSLKATQKVATIEKFQTFDQVVAYMEHFTNLEKRTDKYSVRTYRLDRMQALMQMLGNPQNDYKTIHIAGSKGKGSSASYIAHGLEAVGFKVGLYMSPHVSDYRERFTICGRFIDDSLLVQTGNMLKEKLQGFHFCDTLGENEPTTFELYTAFAFLLFKEAGCQWAVIETGLGGRLDATNILKPQGSVLTPIELEHTNILGNTIEKIAIEKSKIIKHCTPVFTSQQKTDAIEVFRREANAQQSELYEFDKCIKKIDAHYKDGKQWVKVEFNDNFSTSYSLSMAGDVQAQNSVLALMVLRHFGYYSKGATEKAFAENTLPGRMETVNWKRPLILDGAHTENSMEHLLKTFKQMYPQKKGVCIFGAVEGKNHEAMSELILETFDKIIVSRPGTFKKSNPEELFKIIDDKIKNNDAFKEKKVYLESEAKDALELALKLTTHDEPVLVCGSFYLAGVMKDELERNGIDY